MFAHSLNQLLNIVQGNSTMLSMIHLTLSMTFPNLQAPSGIFNNLNRLENTFPHAFSWAGEINVFKHALASNGFFEGQRVTEKMVKEGIVFFALVCCLWCCIKLFG